MTRPWLAPRALRTAISFLREAAPASSKFATFAQPISNTQPTAPSSTSSVNRTLPTTRSSNGIRNNLWFALVLG